MLALRHSRPVPLQTEDATARRTSQILRIAEEAACSLEERLKPGSVSREKIDQRLAKIETETVTLAPYDRSHQRVTILKGYLDLVANPRGRSVLRSSGRIRKR